MSGDLNLNTGHTPVTNIFVGYRQMRAQKLKIERKCRHTGKLPDARIVGDLQTKIDAMRMLIAVKYDHLLQSDAKAILKKLRVGLELSELVNEGFFGLIYAIDRFQPARGYKFETFATRRVKGSISDYLRKLDPASRTSRKQINQLNKAEETFKQDHGRPAGDDELIKLLETTAVKLQLMRKLRSAHQTTSLDQQSNDAQDSGNNHETLADKKAADPFREIKHKLMKQYMMANLKKREQLVMVLYYFEEMSMAEVGRVLGCCESRISQMLDDIRQRMRDKFRENGLDNPGMNAA